MVINFFSNTSDKRFVNKNIVLVASIENAVLLDDVVSVTSPHFKVQGVAWGTINYCYVPEFNRYYYITDVEMLHGNISNITCAVDVLMSFKNDILNASGIVERSTYNGNILIADSGYNVNRVDETLTNLAFSGCEFSSNISNVSDNFLLVTFGGKTKEV